MVLEDEPMTQTAIDRVVYISLLLVAIILAWAWFSTGPAPVDCIPAEEECSSLGDSSP